MSAGATGGPPTPAASPFAALDPCVHCGFCLPACPTYLATGDEADSPRGRIVLMRALERGEIAPTDQAMLQHLDACLGCRGCEPVCPAGVGYGRGLEAARTLLARERGFRPLARLVLAVFARTWAWRAIFGAARLLREAGVASLLASDRRFGLAMLAATAPARRGAARPVVGGAAAPGPTVALFRGCVMDALFDHVHAATRRTLEANGYTVREAPGQVCCGALHDHAGDPESARALARRNLAAFGAEADIIVVNSAGCGALLKDYGHLLGDAAAAAFAARVRDVSELLAERGPRPGGALALDVAYDAPCHLQHAQRVHEPVLALLRAIPDLRLALLPGHDRCCGSAGIYSLLEPAMSQMVLQAKVEGIAAAMPRPAFVVTGNPGCLMQIGGGLAAAGLPIRVAHPVELLDWSYAAGGVYEGGKAVRR
ncbi:MAG: 4Fe-4S dicluster domain-containing protein [Gemmatimonadetes bacterium]|nr:4Fe-4S dicluster domain-containing protein [Gemmatimonadota bacterium]MBK6781382.1 4Fe-4S dicluster domain-containing protein [Gemmatimonadota bacterium]MBK7925377.1 4Fe-4S dicluster domain-containing protein [Gemmatimonadota bacterium]MBK9067516.1 4Fe-4S dicluster domain-containing protein [Gemmatimonadota bacterium]MBP9202195.1 4Fe-4S dicluster domain-containing protein [Gemmatimonadales bacterium]